MKVKTDFETKLGLALIIVGLLLCGFSAIFHHEFSLNGFIAILWGMLWAFTDRLAVCFNRYAFLFWAMLILLALPMILTLLSDLRLVQLPSFLLTEGVILTSLLSLTALSKLEKRMIDLKKD